MLKEEYAILKQKHLKNGCDSREAHELISIFKEECEKNKRKMKEQKKSEAEIKNKQDELFQEEFQKLCYGD